MHMKVRHKMNKKMRGPLRILTNVESNIKSTEKLLIDDLSISIRKNVKNLYLMTCHVPALWKK